jgi:hypothetical protein
VRRGPRRQRKLRHGERAHVPHRREVPRFFGFCPGHKDYQAEIPAFAAEIKDIFEKWEIAQYVERARHREPFDPADYEDDDEMDEEDIEMERKNDIREAARHLLLVEQAREWFLGTNSGKLPMHYSL